MKAIRLMAAGLAAVTAKAITGGSDVETGVTATGATSQANSYALKASITSFTAGGAGTGARLPADLNVGDSVIIANYTGAALLLYPPTGGNLNNAGVNTSLSLPDKDVIQVTCISPLVFSAPLSGIVNPNTPILPSATVAAAGTIQGDATPITTGFTLVTAADGAKGVQLPTAAAGLMCIVKNIDVANAVLKVWPFLGDGINAVAVNSALSMAAKTSAVFVAYDATTWYTVPLLPS